MKLRIYRQGLQGDRVDDATAVHVLFDDGAPAAIVHEVAPGHLIFKHAGEAGFEAFARALGYDRIEIVETIASPMLDEMRI